jgi:hypothetical protein
MRRRRRAGTASAMGRHSLHSRSRHSAPAGHRYRPRASPRRPCPRRRQPSRHRRPSTRRSPARPPARRRTHAPPKPGSTAATPRVIPSSPCGPAAAQPAHVAPAGSTPWHATSPGGAERPGPGVCTPSSGSAFRARELDKLTRPGPLPRRAEERRRDNRSRRSPTAGRQRISATAQLRGVDRPLLRGRLGLLTCCCTPCPAAPVGLVAAGFTLAGAGQTGDLVSDRRPRLGQAHR